MVDIRFNRIPNLHTVGSVRRGEKKPKRRREGRDSGQREEKGKKKDGIDIRA